MKNNDILFLVRDILEIDDASLATIFSATANEIPPEQYVTWFKEPEDEEYQECKDRDMAIFLNGLINVRRGKKDGPEPEPEEKLNNNIIFRKLKIALNMQADDIIQILDLVECELSKHELSALFRRPNHRNYRECSDFILRSFLEGMLESLELELEADV